MRPMHCDESEKGLVMPHGARIDAHSRILKLGTQFAAQSETMTMPLRFGSQALPIGHDLQQISA